MQKASIPRSTTANDIWVNEKRHTYYMFFTMVVKATVSSLGVLLCLGCNMEMMVESLLASPPLIGSRFFSSSSLGTDTLGRCPSIRAADDDEMPPAQIKPDILQPFLPAADPMYDIRGPVGENDFVLSREGAPTADELSNENLLKILMIECSDLEVNTLVWKCLGYRFDAANEVWTNEELFPKWKEKYPSPPDLIGMRRIYSKEIDQPSLKANQALVRSIPVDNKQSLKTHLKPYGFRGYKYAELTPNKTRRAQCANWLLFYREELFGYTVEELKEKRRLKKEAEEAERKRLEAEGKNSDDEWKPPVKEVF